MFNDPEVPWKLKVYGGLGGVADRKLPKRAVREQILNNQGNRCIYCDGEFDQYSVYKGVPVILSVEWDHFVPYVFTGNNDQDNFVASCQICNRIKSDQHFTSVNQAREYILSRRHIITPNGSKNQRPKAFSAQNTSGQGHVPQRHLLEGGKRCSCCHFSLHEYFYYSDSFSCIACVRDCRGSKVCNLGKKWGCDECYKGASTPHPSTGHGGTQRLLH